MTRLSVNVNKVATLRNARGGHFPSVLEAARVCVEAGAPGITVHPRADERHIRGADVLELAEWLAPRRETVEFNIEGDPRPDLLEMVARVRPHQLTLVPVRPGEITSEAGWSPETEDGALASVVDRMRRLGIRVSLFVDAAPAAVRWAAAMGADRVELYTQPYAEAHAEAHAGGGARLGEAMEGYAAAARLARELGLGVNAGHDLDLDNLGPFLAAVPGVDEVSIGHALIGQALFDGLSSVVRAYLEITRRAPRSAP